MTDQARHLRITYGTKALVRKNTGCDYPTIHLEGDLKVARGASLVGPFSGSLPLSIVQKHAHVLANGDSVHRVEVSVEFEEGENFRRPHMRPQGLQPPVYQHARLSVTGGGNISEWSAKMAGGGIPLYAVHS